MGGGPSLQPPKLSFMGGQQACEPVRLQLLCGNGVRELWEREDPLCVHKFNFEITKYHYMSRFWPFVFQQQIYDVGGGNNV